MKHSRLLWVLAVLAIVCSLFVACDQKKPHTHEFGTPTYEWSEDNTTCTATRVCAGDASHVETETVNAVKTVTQEKSCEQDELSSLTATFTNPAFEAQTKTDVKTADKTGHTYGEVTYAWSEDNTTCTATRVCAGDASHVETETVNAVKTVTQEKSCEQDELSSLTATFTNPAFEAQTKTDVKTADKTGHTYGEVTYAWSEDNTTCTATRVCAGDASHVETETVNATKTVTQEKSCEQDELSGFTATFTNSAFEAQTKTDVKTADKTGHTYGEVTYEWSGDNTTCTATRVCAHDASHKETETVNATKTVTQEKSCEQDELSGFTASFTNSAFEAQTKTDVKTADKTGHTYGEVTYAWSGDNTTCTATRVCAHDASHKETETVNAAKTVTQEKSCEQDELSTLTATFTNSAFKAQTKTDVKTAVKTGHTYGDWTLNTTPTLTEGGIATRACACGHVDTVDVPALEDSSVWTLTSTVAPDYTTPGSKTYASVYGEVTVETDPCLAAPFANRTYYAYRFTLEQPATGSNWLDDSELLPQNVHYVTLDANGCGTGNGWALRGETTWSWIDPSIGKIDIHNGTSYSGEGWLDLDTGVAFRYFRNDYSVQIFLYYPYEQPITDVFASAWNDQTIAIRYSYEGVEYRVFFDGTRAHFGVSFEGMDGTPILPENVSSAAHVSIRGGDGSTILAYGLKDGVMVALDGLQGTYVNEQGSILLDGIGGITMNDKVGTYAKSADADTYDVYILVDGVQTEYYVLTLNGIAFEMVKPMVTITYVTEFGSVAQTTVNVNIPYALPMGLTMDTHTLKGWYLRGGDTSAVVTSILPSLDATYVAVWAEKVVINLSGVLAGDPTSVVLGDGDILGDYLPAYVLGNAYIVNGENKIFAGWFLGEMPLGDVNSITLTTEDSGATIEAHWAGLPAYVGTYYGGEIWGASYGNSGGKTLTIAPDGTITTNISRNGIQGAKVIGYDPVTQTITYLPVDSDTPLVFYFDAASGVIAGIYTKNEISNDYYFFCRDLEGSNGKAVASYGVYVPKEPGSDQKGYYAQFVELPATEEGGQTRIIFLYNNHIYSNVSVTDAVGKPLAVGNITVSANPELYGIRYSKTLLVTDNTTGQALIRVGAEADCFNTSSTKTVMLDDVMGTYTNATETVALDGAGNIVYGSKTGTYAKVEGTDTLEVYFRIGEVSEYYVLTLNGTSFEMVKPMVYITYVTEHATVESPVSVNKNIAFLLPTGLDSELYIFKGWYLQGDETKTILTTVIPTADTTYVALWEEKAILTITYNDGQTADTTTAYGMGDVVEVSDPTFTKHKFEGWFTTADFQTGTEWVSGTVITGGLHIYAKWTEAPIYNDSYLAIEITGTSANGNESSLYARTSAILNLDPNGRFTGTAYPFRGEVEVRDYDPVNGTLKLFVGTDFYRGYIHGDSGVMLLTKDKGDSATFKTVMLLIGDSTKYGVTNAANDYNISSSYWNGGNTRVIEYTYAKDGETRVLSIFIENNTVTMGVRLLDAPENGQAVSGLLAYKADDLYVVDAQGAVLAHYGYNGTTLVAAADNAGTYTNEVDGQPAVYINGVKYIRIGSHAGTYTMGEDGLVKAYVTEDGVLTYYEITIHTEAGNCLVNKPMAQVSWNYGGHGTDTSVSVNIGVPLALPEVEAVEGFIFRYWYVLNNGEEEILNGDSYTPVADVTLYAKWDARVTLTIVYGNGLEDVVVSDKYAGDTIDFVALQPGYTNAKVFAGWSTSAVDNVPFTGTSITEDTTLYCVWAESAPYEINPQSGKYGFTVEDTTYTSANKAVSSSTAEMSIVAYAAITVTFDYTVSSEARYDKFLVARVGDMTSALDESGEKTGTLTVVLQAGEVLKLQYKKDGSGNNGNDCVVISNLVIVA